LRYPKYRMIILEDGTGRADANSYADINEADLYHSLRGNSDWTDADITDKIAALVRATDYIESTYEADNEPLTDVQSLQWPVKGDWRLNPTVISATIELALYALKGPLSAPAERGIKSNTQKLEGVGELSTVYDDASAEAFPAITSKLSRIASLRGAGVKVRIGRLIR
jgi:hypothetical protein